MRKTCIDDRSVNCLSHDLVSLSWIATFRPLYCRSSSGDGVDWLGIFTSYALVACDWCISILNVLIRRSFLRGPLWYQSAVVLFDRGHPCFWNFNSVFPIDFVRVKSYVNGLPNPTGLPVWDALHKRRRTSVRNNN